MTKPKGMDKVAFMGLAKIFSEEIKAGVWQYGVMESAWQGYSLNRKKFQKDLTNVE